MPEYMRRFPLVEVQHTFYEPPNDALLMKWRAQAPPQFEFTIKAWQLVTHESNSPTVLFNNLPRVGDAARFMALVGDRPAS